VLRTLLLRYYKDMLARGRNDTQCTNQFTAPSGVPGPAHPAPVAPWTIIPSQQMSRVDGGPIGSAPGMNMISIAFDEIEHARLNTGGMGKRNLSPTNGRRKTDESTIKAPTNKKPKTNAAATNIDKDFSDEGFTIRQEESVSMSKVTDDEKRKTFLERNRYILQSLIVLYCGSLMTLLKPASLPTSVASRGSNGLYKCRQRLSRSVRRTIPWWGKSPISERR